MFEAFLLSPFNPYPGITIAIDDVITTTDDVITATDDVIHIICIDLEGKLMCCKKVACFYDNKFCISNLWSGITYGNIDATIITQQQKICCWSEFLYTKNLFN